MTVENSKIIQYDPRNLTSFERANIKNILCNSFEADPMFLHMVRGRERGPKFRDWWMETFLNYGLKYGKVFGTSNFSDGVSIWLGPSEPIINTWKAIPTGLYKTPFKVAPKEFFRIIKITNLVQSWQRKQNRQFYYLLMLGVAPKCQGQGLGKALVRPMLERADQEGLPCYLETCKEDNLGYYQTMNFKIIENTKISQDESVLPFWGMMREAQAH